MFIIFDGRNTTVAIFKIMQCNGIFREIALDVVFDADVIIQFRRFRFRKRAFPLHVQIGFFPKTTNTQSGLKLLCSRFYVKRIVFK